MTMRRRMNLEDWAITAMAVGVGIFVGMILMTLVGLMVGGLWILVVIFLPLLLLQFVFEGALYGLWYGGRRLFGFTDRPQKPQPEPDVTVPWLRDKSFLIGLVFGATFTTLFGNIWSLA